MEVGAGAIGTSRRPCLADWQTKMVSDHGAGVKQNRGDPPDTSWSCSIVIRLEPAGLTVVAFPMGIGLGPVTVPGDLPPPSLLRSRQWCRLVDAARHAT